MSFHVGEIARTACIWEARARKVGNVHVERDFPTLRYVDFLASADAITPVMARAGQQSVGQTILASVRATRHVVSTNTNLGMILLLAPLATAAPGPSGRLRSRLAEVLQALSFEDSHQVFEAIRLATPGGMGKVPEQDLACQPTLPLREVMALAAERDLIARQYVNDFQDVFQTGVLAIEEFLGTTGNLEQAIVGTHLTFLSRFPDSLIQRKRGADQAKQASQRALGILSLDWPKSPESQRAFAEFDAWLCAERHARNPGTSADLVAASLFVALWESIIKLPPQYPWSHGKEHG